jgi:Rad3-related DNA helicase
MSQLCPLMNARKRARAAGIVFVNHALILTDYMQGNSILGPYQCAVFDEAHHLEDCVVENLSVSVSSGDIDRLFEQAAPVSLADDRWKFLALELEAAGNLKEPRGRIEKLSAVMAGLAASFETFFDSVTTLLNPRGAFRGVRTRYHDGGEIFADAREHITEIQYNINELKNILKIILEAMEGRQAGMLTQDLSFIEEQAGIVSEAMEYLTGGSDEESVFWIEWSASGRAVSICGSPLRVDRRFADFLESSCESAVFTSATLAERGSFEFIKENLGIRLRPGQPIELVSGSPFSYGENCMILLQNGLGDPNEAGFAEKAGEVVRALAMETECRIMVLLTSYRMCRSMADFLSEKQVRETLLVQDGTESREALAARFRSSEGAILLGVASFWEGVDFPGDQLEMLVIPKLPFPVPTEPVIEARSERLRRLGENPFTKLHLPLAVLRLRQGIGRLIRRSGDRGVVVILDSRLSSRPYGSIILSTLPVPVVETASTGETASRAAAWIGSRSAEPDGMNN